MNDIASQSGDDQHRFEISRRNSHSRSKSNKREELEEKMDEIMKNANAASSGTDSEHDNENEYKSNDYDTKYNEYGQLLNECMLFFENIIDDQHIATPIGSTTASSITSTLKSNNTNNIDTEMFKDLLISVRNKLKNDKYGGDLHKRNISELRRKSKSANSSMMETLDHYILSTDDENQRSPIHSNAVGDDDDEEEEEEEEVNDLRIEDKDKIEQEEEHKELEIDIDNNDDNGNGDVTTYEADNEDLDNLNNDKITIDPIDDNQKKCVDQFLMRYSENNAWKKRKDDDNGDDEYILEIEFNENVNLENKKKNNISISSNLLESLTNLIENIMGIENVNPSKYFSMWYVLYFYVLYFFVL